MNFMLLFFKEPLVLTKVAFLWSKEIILKNIIILWNIITINIYMYSCDGKVEFSTAITAVFSVTWSFRNNSNIQSCCLRNIYHFLSMSKTLVEKVILWKKFKRRVFIWNYVSTVILINSKRPCWTKVLISYKLLKIKIITDPKLCKAYACFQLEPENRSCK